MVALMRPEPRTPPRRTKPERTKWLGKPVMRLEVPPTPTRAPPTRTRTPTPGMQVPAAILAPLALPAILAILAPLAPLALPAILGRHLWASVIDPRTILEMPVGIRQS